MISLESKHQSFWDLTIKILYKDHSVCHEWVKILQLLEEDLLIPRGFIKGSPQGKLSGYEGDFAWLAKRNSVN